MTKLRQRVYGSLLALLFGCGEADIKIELEVKTLNNDGRTRIYCLKSGGEECYTKERLLNYLEMRVLK